MKIAFCFLTYGDLNQPAIWSRFFSNARIDQYNIYCHPKFPEQITHPLLRNRVVGQRVPTAHGHISLVSATLILLLMAIRDDENNQYFILTSESTIPIRSFDQIRCEALGLVSRSIFKSSVPPHNSEHFKRLHQIDNPGRFLPDFYVHDQWIVLSRAHAIKLTEQIFVNEFAKMFAPDEHYFLNVLVHLLGTPIEEVVNRRTTFVNWEEREVRHYIDPQTQRPFARTTHPKTYSTLSLADLAAAHRENCWFFRKVDPRCDCDVVLDLIDAR